MRAPGRDGVDDVESPSATFIYVVIGLVVGQGQAAGKAVERDN